MITTNFQSKIVGVTFLPGGAIPAGNVIGSVGVVVPSIVDKPGDGFVLESLSITNTAGVSAAGYLVFFTDTASTDISSEGVFTIGTHAANVAGLVEVTADDYVTTGGATIATLRGIGLVLRAAPHTASLHVAFVATAEVEFGGSDTMTLNFGILQN